MNPDGVTIPPAWSSHTFLAEMVDEPLAIHETGEAIVVEHNSRRGMAFIGVGKPTAIAELLSGLDPRRFIRGTMIRGTWELLGTMYAPVSPSQPQKTGTGWMPTSCLKYQDLIRFASSTE